MGRTQQDNTAAECSDRGRARARVRFATLLVLSAVSCLLSTACRPNKRYDGIEAELRTRNKELAETKAALEQAQTLNRAYEQGRGQAPIPGAPVAPPSAVPPGCPIREIALGRGTGGVDDDGLPGDESLMVVIVPRDEDKSEVKVTARAQIVAWEITQQGLKNPIGSWDIPPEKLRPTWRNGLMSTGYFVALPWQTFPTTDRVRVAVRLITAEGQVFEADRDISVRPVPQAVPRSVPQPVPAAPPSVPAVPG
ncbi:MAG TPA: hypothetical protein VKE74_21000, partial [Gemmataceae bacterium]|nr:hypothetical protein [Gemmataceae bacterium]